MKVLWLTEYSDRGERAQVNGLLAAGIDLHLMCPHYAPMHQRYLDDGLPVIDFAPSKRIDRHGARRIRDFVTTNKIDIVHTFNARALTAAILALRDIPHVRLVAYRGIVGNLSFLDPMSWMRYLNRRIDTIVCVAEAIRQFFLNMRPRFLAMPPERIVTIHKGHDPNWYRDPPADLSRFGITEGDIVIGCVANARPRKGIPVLIEATKKLPTDLPWKLLLVGQMESPDIDRSIDRLSHPERIVRTGYSDSAPAIIAACDFAVLPSLRREGLPRGVIEAMAQGVPNIVTDTGGSPELIVAGESGLVVPSGDADALAGAIEQLARDESLRHSMGAKARERIATHFHYTQTVEKTLALYRRLLEQR